jgi:hypothetical protein
MNTRSPVRSDCSRLLPPTPPSRLGRIEEPTTPTVLKTNVTTRKAMRSASA